MSASRPPVGPPRPWSFPDPARTELPNGLRLLAYDVPGQHVLSLRLGVPSPIGLEPRHVEGVGSLVARTLDEGTDRVCALEFAEALERSGAALGATVVERGLLVDLDAPAGRLPEALDLFRQAVTEPVFPEDAVARHVRIRLQEIEQERAHPTYRAAVAFADAYYDPADRLSRPTGGTPETVSTLTAAELRAHHRRLGPEGAALVIAGDLAGTGAAQAAAAALSAWEPARPASGAPTFGGQRAVDADRLVLVDRPGSVQSELYIGCAGPDRRVAGGWAPYPVLAFVLGGAPQSRLDAVLREQKGYTYGMRCAFRPRASGGLFIASGSVRAEASAPALELALGILEGARDGFTTAEATAGADFLVKTAPGRYATADAVADEAVARELDGLGTAHTTQVLRETSSLTAERLGEAYATFVGPPWTIVVVGDAQRHHDALAALGRGRVEVVGH